jgi:hypothetical protein
LLQRISPSPRPCVTLCNMLVFYGWRLFSSHPAPILSCL